jgi:hypothetical protein
VKAHIHTAFPWIVHSEREAGWRRMRRQRGPRMLKRLMWMRRKRRTGGRRWRDSDGEGQFEADGGSL